MLYVRLVLAGQVNWYIGAELADADAAGALIERPAGRPDVKVDTTVEVVVVDCL